MTGALEFGLLLPHEEGPGLPPVTWASIRDTAMTAEDMRLDSLWVVDHFLWRGDPWRRDEILGLPADQRYGVTECWTTLSAVAAVTSRVRLGTLVTCAAYRNPALLAKMADTADMVSDGRLILGLGAGDYPPEHEMIGVPTDRPFARFEEALAIIVPLLRNGHVDFEGEFYRVRDMELRPRGPRPQGPPVMIGSFAQGPRALRLISRYADIWNTWLVHAPADDLRNLQDRVDAGCLDNDRDPATLRRVVGVPIRLEGPALPWPGVVSGLDEEIAETLIRIAGNRVDEIQALLLPATPASVERLGGIIDMVRTNFPNTELDH